MVGMIWAAVGVIFLVIIRLIKHFAGKKNSKCTAESWATVTDMREGKSQDSDGHEYTIYRPVYQFTTAWNEMVEAVSSAGYDRRTCSKMIGIQRKVFYDPQNPHNFYTVEEEKIFNRILKILQIVGIVSLIGGAIILAFPIWKKLLPVDKMIAAMLH